jgi:hypothetical protein
MEMVADRRSDQPWNNATRSKLRSDPRHHGYHLSQKHISLGALLFGRIIERRETQLVHPRIKIAERAYFEFAPSTYLEHSGVLLIALWASAFDE